MLEGRRGRSLASRACSRVSLQSLDSESCLSSGPVNKSLAGRKLSISLDVTWDGLCASPRACFGVQLSVFVKNGKRLGNLPLPV